jgi:hypothetical protein
MVGRGLKLLIAKGKCWEMLYRASALDGFLAPVGQMRNAYTILVRKPEDLGEYGRVILG